jgi:fructose-specific phosphotransferase system IIA component
MLISDIVQPRSILVPLAAKDKESAIGALVDRLSGGAAVSDPAELKRAVLQREQTRTTGIGYGVAIPHGKCPGCRQLSMAIARLAEPIDFASIDGKPVDLIFLLASPQDQTGPHIQMLAAISRMLIDQELRSALKRADSPQALFKLIVDHESARVS